MIRTLPPPLYLKNGEVARLGETAKVIQDFYAEGLAPTAEPEPVEVVEPVSSTLDGPGIEKYAVASIVDTATLESEFFEIKAINLLDEKERSTTQFKIGQPCVFQIIFQPKKLTDNTHFSIAVKNKLDQVVSCAGTYSDKKDPLEMQLGQVYQLRMKIVWSLEAGRYSLSFTFGKNYPERINIGESLFEFSIPEPVSINWNYESEVPPFFGMVGIPYETQFTAIDK